MLYHIAWSGSALVWIALVSRRQRWSHSPEWSQGHRHHRRRNDESRHSTFQWGQSARYKAMLLKMTKIIFDLIEIEKKLTTKHSNGTQKSNHSLSSFLKVANTIFTPLNFDKITVQDRWNKKAPVGQGFWSLVPRLVSAWTRCQREAPPPRLSCSWSTFLGTPLSHTAACNTDGLQLIGCFITTATPMFQR